MTALPPRLRQNKKDTTMEQTVSIYPPAEAMAGTETERQIMSGTRNIAARGNYLCHLAPSPSAFAMSRSVPSPAPFRVIARADETLSGEKKTLPWGWS